MPESPAKTPNSTNTSSVPAMAPNSGRLNRPRQRGMWRTRSSTAAPCASGLLERAACEVVRFIESPGVIVPGRFSGHGRWVTWDASTELPGVPGNQVHVVPGDEGRAGADAVAVVDGVQSIGFQARLEFRV